MPHVYKTAPNGKEVEVWISRFYWQQETTDKEIEREYKMMQQPFWVLAATWLLVVLLVKSVLGSAGEFELFEPPPEEVQAYNKYIIGRLNHGSVMPETKPVRPSVLEVDRFYNKEVGAIWKRALERGADYYHEDYFESMHEVIQVCKRAKMPLYEGVVMLNEWHSQHTAAQELSRVNGRREYPDDAEYRKIQHDLGAVTQAYQSWYRTGTISVPERPDVNWQATENLALWTFLSYLKGMFICGLIFVIRLRGNRYFTLKDEFRFGAKRFAMMVLGWPISFWVYPYHTNTALYARKLRLEAEYLRDKKLGYKLTTAEHQRIERMALQTAISLKSLVRLIAAMQARNRRKALTVVYIMMLFGVLASTFARMSMLAHPIVLIQVVSSFQQLDELPSERDGPEAPVIKRFSSTELFALVPRNLVSLKLNVSRWVETGMYTKCPPGYGKGIDHIPINAPLFCLVTQT